VWSTLLWAREGQLLISSLVSDVRGGSEEEISPLPILVAYLELLIWYPVGRVGRMLGWGGEGVGCVCMGKCLPNILCQPLRLL
jgi:hypothetical protein